MEKKRGFVISPIGREGSEVRRHVDYVYEFIIRPALKACDVDGPRADHLSEPGKITDQMFKEIFGGAFCIALLTGHNPNVFYELAMAQAAEKPIVFLIEKGSEMPFDVKDWRCIHYDLEMSSILSRIYAEELTKQINDIKSQGWKAESPLTHYGVKIGEPMKGRTPRTLRNDQRVCYLLRGIKETYLRRLVELSQPPNIKVRLNIMAREPERTDEDCSLRIVAADYWNDYQDVEKYDKWHAGEGKVGEAWETARPAIYTPGIRSKKGGFVREGKKHMRAYDIKSVLSTPILWKDQPIAILNMDSCHKAKETLVHRETVQDLFMAGARELASLLITIDPRWKLPLP